MINSQVYYLHINKRRLYLGVLMQSFDRERNLRK